VTKPVWRRRKGGLTGWLSPFTPTKAGASGQIGPFTVTSGRRIYAWGARIDQWLRKAVGR
jgi:hypothetical protein